MVFKFLLGIRARPGKIGLDFPAKTRTLMAPTSLSPLRYPGGKSRAVSILETLLLQEYPTQKTLLSPFLGGGSFELFLLRKNYTVLANDRFTPLYTFWKMLKEQPAALQTAVRRYKPMSKELFQSLRQSIQTDTDELTIAAKYFAINRSSFSGATFCGGYSSESGEKRFTESSIEKLGTFTLPNFSISNLDWTTFLQNHPQTASTVLYLDPPYYISTYLYGRDGDLHEGFDHEAFATEIKKRSDWILCYNDCEYIRNLYKDCRIQKVNWSYGMNAKKESSEILILPPK